MIMFVMAVLLLVPLAAAIEAVVLVKGQNRARGMAAGLAAGALGWNAHIYWGASAWISGLLALSAIAILAWAALRHGRTLRPIGAAAAAAAFLFLAWDGALMGWVNRAPPPTFTRDPLEASQRALIVLHPGGSDFARQVSSGIAEGLRGSGWAVDIASASAQAPLPDRCHALLIVVTPTYNWGEVALPVRKYIGRLNPLGELAVADVTTGAGWAPNRDLFHQLRQSGGRVVASATIFTTAPNFIDGRPASSAETARDFGAAAARAASAPS